ncbi:MAG: hypothetical protein K6F05_02785 [Succinivibrio sp.]|nr:hypothetical protein [Succinivibrio sp.]
MKSKQISVLSLAILLALKAQAAPAEPDNAVNPEYQKDPLQYSSDDALAFNRTAAFTRHKVKLNGQDVTFRAFNHLPYVNRRSCKNCQHLDLYIPEAYFEGGTINSYKARSAPIFVPNSAGQYQQGKIVPPEQGSSEASVYALSRGYVVVSPALRGRDSLSDSGAPIGAIPASLVDYKAVVRYLRHNSDKLPAGDVSKIISSGAGSGGAISVVLGVSGNSPEFEPYLKELGAAPGDDSVFAAISYCPRTDLEHLDYAYEWQYEEVDSYFPHRRANPNSAELPKPLDMTDKEQDLSEQLARSFPAYLNSLQLSSPQGTELSLDDKGEGSFADYFTSLLQDAAQQALKAGKDLQVEPWAEVEDNKVLPVDFDTYARTITRLRKAPAFDRLDLSSSENKLFSQDGRQPCHFNELIAKQAEQQPCVATPEQLRLINPFSYIYAGKTQFARYFWLRHGTLDREVPMTISAMLALALENHGAAVNFKVDFHRAHSGDYDLKELFNWLDTLCQKH